MSTEASVAGPAAAQFEPFEVPAGTERLTVLDVSLRTFKRGTTVTVQSCSAA